MSEDRTSPRRISIDDLHRYCVQAMRTCGMRPEDARITADVLVTTDSWGVHTHGTKSLRTYLARVRAGGVDATAVPRVSAQGPGWAMVEARKAMAMVVSHRAMSIAMEKARACGIGYVGVTGSTHFGAAGYYASMAAAQGMIGIAMSNVDTNMNAPGAAGGVIGNNPFAYAVPRGNEHPLMLDMALSTVAAGKVVAALERGEPIPDTWLVDADGKPSTNPADYPTRATLSPLAGYKGYGLALMVEVLAAALTGAAMTREIHSWTQELDTVTGEGHAFIAIDCGAMMPEGVFAGRMRTMTESITGAPRAPGARRIWLPGQKEWEKREEALRSGILLPADVVASLRAMGEELHLQPPAFMTA